MGVATVRREGMITQEKEKVTARFILHEVDFGARENFIPVGWLEIPTTVAQRLCLALDL